jgi:hypothetical protein
VLASVAFVTPLGGLVAVAVVLPLLAAALVTRRAARGRAELRLSAPARRSHAAVLAVGAVPVLAGLAAASPVLRTHTGRRVRTDAQALFLFDTSRSMAASASFTAPTRFMQAQATAIKLRGAIPEIPSGVVSFTTQVIPHLFPTSDLAAFDSTVETAIGVERPPPPFFKFGVSGTSFGPIGTLRNQGFFNPATKSRYVVVLTDGESGPFDPDALKAQLVLAPQRQAVFPGRPLTAPEAPVSLLVVRVGTPSDRIYSGPNTVEAAYHPDARAGEIADELAAVTGGRAFTAARLSPAISALKRLVGSGHGSLQGVRTKTTALAPFIVLLIFAPLGLVLRSRNTTNL